MSSAAERLAAAKLRDEEGIEQDTPEEEEAAETEPEQPGEFEAPADVPPTEPEQPEQAQADTGLDAEQAVELEKATTAYYKRVAKVFGGELPPECPTCNGLAFDLTGGQGAPTFREHEQYKGCDECDGLGKVKTGSQVHGHDLADCPKCQGRGYLEKLPVPQAVPDQPQEYGTPAWMGTVPPPPPS